MSKAVHKQYNKSDHMLISWTMTLVDNICSVEITFDP
jgi:hypothetical protein